MPYHTPVMVREVMDWLAPHDGGTYYDLTIGGGGHAEAILKASAPTGKLIGLDRDAEAIAAAREKLRAFGARIEFLSGNMGQLQSLIARVGGPHADGILIDCGVSSHQLDEPARGFSFSREAPLDMRMDQSRGLTAAELLNSTDPRQLAAIFKKWGEEKRAGVIAAAIAKERRRGPLRTTKQLAQLVEKICPRRGARTHPATRVFQALRIAVNDELINLERALEASVPLLNPRGRLVVITYHSLEDRIVKNFFRRMSTDCICPAKLPACVCGQQRKLRILTRKPIVPSESEIGQNPRARSAKLRAAERVVGGDQG
jgi:16S rRNA (cytosine1402-N4)-methyltransferase